jgi:hypothetical protein
MGMLSRTRHPFPGHNRVPLILAIACIPVLTGCGERPRQEQLSLARTHLAAAEASVGAAFAKEELQLARDSLAETEAEYKEQDGFRLKRSPDEAHRLVERTIELSEAASEIGDEIWRQTSKDARKALAKSETAMVTLDAALSRLVRCHKQKGIKGARKMVKETNQVKERYQAASTSFDEGAFETTVELATGLPEEAGRVTNNLEQAIRGSSCFALPDEDS